MSLPNGQSLVLLKAVSLQNGYLFSSEYDSDLTARMMAKPFKGNSKIIPNPTEREVTIIVDVASIKLSFLQVQLCRSNNRQTGIKLILPSRDTPR
ncbi:hypothetical protein J6590_085838 [Homalodisca vitripennis]|nr:hypothetical protein J6590_085838 [Homalodisca vitripennis]